SRGLDHHAGLRRSRPAELPPVWSKYSCGARVIVQQPAESLNQLLLCNHELASVRAWAGIGSAVQSPPSVKMACNFERLALSSSATRIKQDRPMPDISYENVNSPRTSL